MGFISETLGGRIGSSKPTTILAGGETITMASSDPAQKSAKVESKIVRVSAEELEQTYVSDPIAFNSVNKATQMIMSAGWKFVDDKGEYEKLFSKIGRIGDDLTLAEIFDACYRYGFVYGKAFVELVYNSDDTKIVDFALMDPKRTDYARDAEKKIVRDKYGKPVGYVQTIPYGYDTKGKSDPIPLGFENKVDLKDSAIFLLPKRVFLFKMYTIGDRDNPIGILEPAYRSIVRKQNIEEAQANSIYSRGTYPVIAYVGDQDHESTAQDIQATLDNLTKLKHDRYLAFQHWIKVEPLEVKQSDVVESTINALIMNQIAASGIPKPFATGGGEETNRATLNNLQQLLEYTLIDVVNRFVSSFTKYVLNRIHETNKLGYVPKLQWGDIKAEDPNEKIKRLTESVKVGILLPTEVHDYVLNMEGIEKW